jgi:hypothetical protein
MVIEPPQLTRKTLRRETHEVPWTRMGLPTKRIAVASRRSVSTVRWATADFVAARFTLSCPEVPRTARRFDPKAL